MAQAKIKKMAARKRPASKAEFKENEPAYMIQINDPKGLRKDALEGLRETILFMQGDENFRKIQDEKLSLFVKLKTQVRELNSLVENKLRRLLPKGRIKDQPLEKEEKIEKAKPEPKVVAPKPVPQPEPEEVEEEEAQPVQKSELEELEEQLKEIEGQLRGY